jgi:hypothetical protein
MRVSRLVVLAPLAVGWPVSCADPEEISNAALPEGGAAAGGRDAAGTDGSAASSAAAGVGASGGSTAPDGSATGGSAGGGGSSAGGSAGAPTGGTSTGGTGGTAGGNGGTAGGGRAGSSSGGVAGVAGAAGSGGCGGADSDGDGLQDCDEDSDADPWTDRAVFNGMHVRQSDQCSGSASCSNNDTRAKIDACMTANPIREEKDQYAGWDFSNQPDNLCSAGYGFRPNWTVCDIRWQAEWRGFVNFTGAGNHCFAIIGNTDEQCGALLFNTETAALQTGQAAKCFDVAAGVYPIRWHYTMDNTVANNSSMRVAYCFGGAGSCVPANALPSRMLRTTYP